MNDIKKIAILGGTGKAGKYLVNQLISYDFHFNLLLRNPENVQVENALIEVVEGDAREYQSIERLVGSCQAVISTLGQPKGESSIFSQATTNVIRAMHHFGIKRYIITTGLNVDTPSDNKGANTKLATDWMLANYPETTIDKQLEYQLLSDSQLDWTLVRLPLIVQTDERSKVLASLEDCPGDKITSSSLAVFLIEQLSDTTYHRKAPFIANVCLNLKGPVMPNSTGGL